jgi:serine protease Do
MRARKTILAIIAISLLPLSALAVDDVRDTPVVKVVKRFGPAVVNIRTETVLNLRDTPEWGLYGKRLDQVFKDYFGKAYSEGTLKYKSIGSGVILDNRGLIVTNAHVIERARSIYAVLIDGTILPGKVVVKNRDQDLAIVKVKLPHPVEKIRLASFDDIRIGETAIAIGDAFGLENSVTVGVISGKNRQFSSTQCSYQCEGLLQTDASINPGNSGGALLNLDGELMGVNLAVVENAQSIGFAVPSYKVEKLMQQFK